MNLKKIECSICQGKCILLDAVDFNKSCAEPGGKHLPVSGVLVAYYLCNQCGFCFAPEFSTWQLKDFANKIYNDKYIEVDPDYLTNRPRTNAENLKGYFKGAEPNICHLDYGGGDGLLSDILLKSGWNSSSYDPFFQKDADINGLGNFNLITVYEVFEHVPNINELMQQLNMLLAKDGIILFTTLLSDGNIRANQRLKWWYAGPRNGHISLFSLKSLQILAKKQNTTTTQRLTEDFE